MSATVKVSYFASLRDAAGLDQELVAMHTGDTAKDLYLRLAERHGFLLGLSDIRVAINDEFSTQDRPLSPDDHLVFIPPVAGG